MLVNLKGKVASCNLTHGVLHLCMHVHLSACPESILHAGNDFLINGYAGFSI